MKKLLSWNVNGLRACVNRGDFLPFFEHIDADVFCVQETKMQPDQLELDLPGYHQYFNSAVKKGYSGTAIFTREEPLSIKSGIGIPAHDMEGRVLTAEYPGYYLVNVYTPNSQEGLARIAYRMEWEEAFKAYLLALDAIKPVIVCGDMNVARTEQDIKHAEQNRGTPGFSDPERKRMEELLASGFLDSFRTLYPDQISYSWWCYFRHAREKNDGWRIDYFLTSAGLKEQIADAVIYEDVYGSDHCPVGLLLKEAE